MFKMFKKTVASVKTISLEKSNTSNKNDKYDRIFQNTTTNSHGKTLMIIIANTSIYNISILFGINILCCAYEIIIIDKSIFQKDMWMNDEEFSKCEWSWRKIWRQFCYLWHFQRFWKCIKFYCTLSSLSYICFFIHWNVWLIWTTFFTDHQLVLLLDLTWFS